MTVILFIVVLAVLVLVHEWGHFFAARKFGIRVDEFGFGFPPKLFSKRAGETLYTLNLFPIGGFVKIFGEGGENAGDPRSFSHHPVWRRMIIVGAGVVMNLILAWVLFSAGAAIGVPSIGDEAHPVSNAKVTITAIADKSPAGEAKLAFGNVIEEVRSGRDEVKPQNASALIAFINNHRGERITLSVLTSAAAKPEEVRQVEIVPRLHPPEGEGPIGIGVADIGIFTAPWYKAPFFGIKNLWFTVETTAEGLWSIVTSLFQQHGVPEGVSGPLGIFTLTSQTERLGISYFIQFVALLSVNLAILNILPIPALDGGRLFFLAIEKLRGKPMHFEYERIAHAIGFVLLLLVILLVSIRDFHRFFS